MRAITFDSYGSADVLKLSEVDKPALARDDDVLVRVRAASANALDWHFMTGLPYIMRLQTGLRRPKCTRLGADFAGVVEAVGGKVTEFRAGDEVFGQVDGEASGTDPLELGAFAEYVRVCADGVAPKPAGLSFEQAAAVGVAATTALQLLRDVGGIQHGQQVLINGASGGVGSFAVQIAKAFDAEVTGVCSTRNVENARALGADHVFDYTREDFTRAGKRYDILLDNVGNRALADIRRVLKPKAVYISSFGRPENLWLGPMVQLMQMSLLAPFVSQRLVSKVAGRSQADMLFLTELIAAGKLTPLIERSYPLSEAAAAMRYLGEGHAQGKITITV